MEANNRLQRTVSSEKPFLIIFTVHCFDDFNFEDESSSTANTQEQLLELGARIDHVSEKMYPILSMVVGMKMNGFKIFNEQVIPVIPARYDFEANKKNNLIFYGLPSDQRETPNALVTKVKHKNERLSTTIERINLRLTSLNQFSNTRDVGSFKLVPGSHCASDEPEHEERCSIDW